MERLEAITVLVSALEGPLLVAIGGVVAAAIWMAANWEKPLAGNAGRVERYM
ncbi:MAG: hypothetical protein ACLUAR_20125 [Pilosibacter sp.]